MDDAIELYPPFAGAGGYCWKAELPPALGADSDEGGGGARSPWRLVEDGNAIGAPHAVHDEISAKGGGRYSHWNRYLYFSAPDNSDPNLNGRSYALRRFAEIGRDRAAIARATRSEWLPPHLVAAPVHEAATRLGDTLRRRQVRELVYFHTDHFEPWVGGGEDRQWRALDRFAALSRRSVFGRRLSLFLTPPVWFSLADPARPTGYRSVAGDGVVFWDRPADMAARCREAFRPLEAEIGHEFHIHVHHENWTRTARTEANYDVADWVNAHSDEAADRDRLDLFLAIARERMSADLGRPLDRWAFVHGHWALNGADPRYCQIDDEIALLRRHGCYGDFTFPAPNPNAQPNSIDGPFTCVPAKGAKSYDTGAGDPLAVTAARAEDGRFFIWNSPIQARHCSLDFYSEDNRRLYRDPETLIRIWLEQSVAIDGRLYLKTHAHSLHSDYRVWEDDCPIPHTYPDIVTLFELLQRACDRAQVPLIPATVNEAMGRLRADGDAQRDAAAATAAPASPIRAKGDGWSAATADRLSNEVYSFLVEEQKEKGVDGLYQWYRYKFVPSKIGLSPYDRAIARFTVANRGLFDRFVEIGAAAAQQSILTAMHGVESVPIESSNVNFDLMSRLIARIAARLDPDLPRYIAPVQDWYPTRAADYVTPRTLLCFPTLSWGLTEEQEQSILDSLPRAAGVILGLRDFFRTRTSAEEQGQLIERIRSLGFDDPVDVYAWHDAEYQFPPDRIVYMARSFGSATRVKRIF